jgi:hypothetical protein
MIMALILAAAGLAVWGASGAFAAADAGAPDCAPTAQSPAPSTASPGNPCWTDVTPYPFGYDGNAVDTSSPECNANADVASCYLTVESMTFRSWNRGLAAVQYIAGGKSISPYGVWLYNGTRWFPDPTFPGSSECQGGTILWAGKLDYWLIGDEGTSSWPSLCRFDGANFDWEPIPVPKAALAQVPQVPVVGSPGEYVPAQGAITAGACLAWDNCWFFGEYGVVLHWDGDALTDASPNLEASPWLDIEYTAAVVRTDAAGNPFGFVVADTPSTPGVTQPDGSPPPQLFSSTGGAFAPLAFSPPTNPQPGDPYRTDLVAVDFDAAGEGWVAGDPTTNTPLAADASPLVRISTAGTPLPCPGTPTDAFPGATHSWYSIGVFPGGDAVAGGTMVGPGGATEPVLARVSCTASPTVANPLIPDPTAADPATAPPIVDQSAAILSVAVNATNDAWAASTDGTIPTTAFGGAAAVGPPQLYHWTDGQTPLAPAGNDDEPRPLVVTQEPSIFVLAPPTVVTPTVTIQTTSKVGTVKKKVKKVAAPVYDFGNRLSSRRANGTFVLSITFKVRGPIRFGLKALRHGKLVSSSGLHSFTKGKRGKLTLTLEPKRWPTKIVAVEPKSKTT